jgi:dienelactone hydrolase
VALTAGTPGVAGAQAFTVRPGPVVLAGDSLAVTLGGLAPNARVEITAERLASACCTPGTPNLLRARAVYRADAAGQVDLARAAPLAGSYTGSTRRGSSGRCGSAARTSTPPASGSAADACGSRREPVAATDTVAGPDVPVVATVVVTLRASDPAVMVDSVPGFPGAVFARLPNAPGAPRRPAIIVLGGSEGGAGTARAYAPKLASHGYAVLGLPYYAPGWGSPREFPTLPADFIDIPVDRLDSARAWLAARPDVDAGRIGLYGVSKGAEYALLAATRFSWVKAVAAIVPSDVVWEGWGAASTAEGTRSSFAWRGAPLPFVPYVGMQAAFAAAQAAGRPASLREPHAAGRRAHPERVAAARIPVERYRGALLVAGGGVDDVWPSAEMAQAIADRRRAAGLPTVVLLFPRAGHPLSGDGWGPTTAHRSAGEPAAIAQAQAATWRATLALFGRALGPVVGGRRPVE